MRMQGFSTLSRVDSAKIALSVWTGEQPSQPGWDHPQFLDEKAQPELGERMNGKVESISSRAYLQSNRVERHLLDLYIW